MTNITFEGHSGTNNSVFKILILLEDVIRYMPDKIYFH